MARRAKCLTILVDETNRTFPKRDKASDGWLGDAAHASRKSDHNPDGNGVVRAQDIDEDLHPDFPHAMEAIVQFVVGLGRQGDPRLNPDGYVIYEGRIWSSAHNWRERPYTGVNAHSKHAHFSCGSRPSGYDLILPWGIADLFPPTVPPPPLPQPQEDDDMPKYIYSIKGAPERGEFVTDGLTTRTLNTPALVHGKNRGWYVDANPKEMDEDEHNWLVANTQGLNVP